jgi:hypothetical protein
MSEVVCLKTVFRTIGVRLEERSLLNREQWMVILQRGTTDISGGWVNWHHNEKFELPISEAEAQLLGSKVGQRITVQFVIKD